MTKVCTLGAVVSKHRIRHIRSSDAPARRCGQQHPEGMSSRRRVPSLHCHVERPTGVET